jgi:hypothetical protein
VGKAWTPHLRSRLAAVIFSAAAVAACDFPSTGGCTLEFLYGVVVDVRDSVTGAPAAAGARLIVRDGAYADTSEQLPSPYTDELILQAAGERGGIYDLTIQKPNYQEWTRRNVWVREGRCHVIPVRLGARLQPAP